MKISNEIIEIIDLKSLTSRSFCHLCHCLPLLIIVREDESILSVVNTRTVQLDHSMPIKDELSGLRRSRRRSVYTTRACQYKEGQKRPVFPSIGDEIKVKWVWNEHPVWWPATVISINNTRQKARTGELLYHKLGDYDSSQATVLFSLSSSKQRFVRSIDSDTRTDSAIRILLLGYIQMKG